LDDISLLTQHRVRFFNRWGFRYLQVVNKCGYCYEFLNPKEGCLNCILYKKKVCSEKISNVTFWRYVREMQKSIKDPSKVNWGKVVSDSILMRETIRKDIVS
jgi:hypothetical protein